MKLNIKDDILLMYLNGAYGGMAWEWILGEVQHFDKPVSELNLAESVNLAGLPQQPQCLFTIFQYSQCLYQSE